VTDALHEFGTCATADIVDQGFAVLAIIGGDAQLDQLVPGQCNVYLGKHGVAQAGRADAHHWIEMVCPGAQRALLFAG
jgi:6-phosphogluconate dehydrogenase (decarboxylating)